VRLGIVGREEYGSGYDLDIPSTRRRRESRVDVSMAEAHELYHKIPKARSVDLAARGTIPLVDRLLGEEETRPQREITIAAGLDDQHLDQHLEGTDIELIDGLIQDVEILLRGANQERIRQFVRGEGFSDRPVPAESVGPAFASVTVGGSHLCGLTASGAAYCWGVNYDGQLGDGSLNGPQPCGGTACSTTPVAVAGGLSFIELSAGNSYTCGVTSTHVAYCWGFNGQGQLGVGNTTGPELCGSGYQCSASPAVVSGGFSITTISAATFHTCAITTAGRAYCWGDGFAGQLGNGTTDRDSVPVAVSGGLTFSQVTTAVAHTCAVTPGGVAYCWGAGGRLGNGDTTNSATPVPVSRYLTFVTVRSGPQSANMCGITRTKANLAVCWGSNSYRQLGNGSTRDSPVPVVVNP
jgi:alpha-tubulin suppressor-like RCC1 family protein